MANPLTAQKQGQVVINNKMKNPELFAAFPELEEMLAQGQIVIIDLVPSKKSPDKFTNIYAIGTVQGIGSADVSKAEAMLLNWEGGGSSTMRVISNCANEVAEQLTIGQALPEDFAIMVYDQIEPRYQGQSPREDRNKNLLYSVQTIEQEDPENPGQMTSVEVDVPIYRNTRLVTKDELKETGHDLIKVDKRIPKVGAGSIPGIIKPGMLTNGEK